MHSPSSSLNTGDQTTWRRLLLHPAFVPGCLVTGLAIRVLVALLLPVEQMSDSAWYVARAQEIVNTLSYEENGYPTAYWPVGWPAILAAGLWLFGSVKVAVIALNLTAATILMLIIPWYLRYLFQNETAARLGLLAYALYPNHIAYTGIAATELVYTALIASGFALLISGRDRMLLVSGSGLCFGIGTLVKAQTVAFPLGAIIALYLVYKNYRLSAALRAGTVVYACLLLVVLPWSLRNQAALGEFVFVSTNGGAALMIGANDHMTGDHFALEKSAAFARLGIPWSERVRRQVELNKRQKEAGKAWIKQHPLRYLAWIPLKIVMLWRKDTDGFYPYADTYPDHPGAVRSLQWLNQAFYVAVLALALPAAFIGLAGLIRRDEYRARIGLLFCMPVFVSLLAAIFTGQVRYHFPAMPFLVASAALIASWILERDTGPITWRGGRPS